MSNLLAITIFGKELAWQLEDALFWLLIAQVALVLLMLVVFGVLIHRVGKDKTVVDVREAAKERKLVGITLDTTAVQRTFAPGEGFNCEGLVAIAHYSSEPVYEPLTEFTVKTAEQLAEEEAAAKAEKPAEEKAEGEKAEAKAKNEVLVIAPSADSTGTAYVRVTFGGMEAAYAVETGAIVQAPVKAAAPERTLLGITLDTSMVQREFQVGEEFNSAGLLVTANYNTEPAAEEIAEYEVEAPDMTIEGKPTVTVRYGGKAASYAVSVAAAPVVEEAPAEEAPERKLVGITLDTAVVQREFRVGDAFNFDGLLVTANYDLDPASEQVTDYTVEAPDMSVEGKPTVTVTYGDKTAVYAITVAAVEETPAEEAPVAEETAATEEPVVIIKPAPIIIEEESYEGGTLRYDKSFTARLIQSDDETKQWYTEMKNDFLSYKKVHDRMSWKRETYRLGRDTVARLSYRGKTLCVFFPLYASDLVDTKYKVEDVSDNVSYADTPCMYRIKNAKRARYACELFALVMEQLQAPRIERESVDYYMPYEGVVELINKGLIKREIVKGKSGAPIFLQSSASEAPAEAATEETTEETAEEVAATEETAAEATTEEAATEATTEEAATEEVATEAATEEAATEETAATEEAVAEATTEEAATEEATTETKE